MGFNLKNLHRISGISISVFIFLHLTNHLFALGGPALHISVMKLFRYIYRFPPVELFLFLCILVQIISGIILIFQRGFRQKPVYFRIQVFSGLYLSLFLINHIKAVLTARYQWHVETDFFFASGVAVHYPEKLFFIPYYTLSVLSVFLHVACAHYVRRQQQISQQAVTADIRLFKKEAYMICLVGIIVTILIMISFTGLLYPL